MTSVLHVISGLGGGGAETMLTQIAAMLQERGLPQHVVSLKGHGVHGEGLEAADVKVTSLGVNSAFALPIAMSRLVKCIARDRPDVVQGWMYHGNIMAAFAHKLAFARGRLMWNIRASNMDEKRYGRIMRLSGRLSHWPDTIISNSHASLNYHAALGIAADSVRVIPNGIDTVRYAPSANIRDSVRGELGIASNAVVAIMVARFDPMKDHETFLAAMAELKDVQGLLVGAAADQIACPVNVMALGFRSDIARLHQCADLIVLSSAFGEGFSNALAEGMSSGLVPVATDVGDAGLIVGNTGRIVPPGNVIAMRTAIAAEAALGAAERSRRGVAARQRILDRFTLARAVDAYAGLYRCDVLA